jgi:putative restriction endonuclease
LHPGSIILSAVQGYIANTDYQWYRFLAARPELDEVNFWRPSGGNFRALSRGEPLLFRLKAPHNAIAGLGFFVHFSILPASLAWSAFEIKNGADSEEAMRRRIETYRRRRGHREGPAQDYRIGCIILAEPVFFDEHDLIPQPRDWHPNTEVGRLEDLTQGEGARIWRAIMERLRGRRVAEPAPSSPRYGEALTIHLRLGQGAFRVLVTDFYDRRCSVTEERTLPVLEAAHIKPYRLGGAHDVTNGLLLRSDLHTLFDRGYMTVTPDYRIEVSRRIREEFENGREYYQLTGRGLRLPRAGTARPDPVLLDWHNSNVFRA